MARNSVLTAAHLRELLHYNPDTGEFHWLSQRGVKLGQKAGCVQTLKTGYKRLMIGVYYRNHRASRLAWLYMTGEWPIGVIDHINENSLDNRWCNLRDASKKTNQQNSSRPQSNNTTGYRGVVFVRLRKPWRATFAGKFIGNFKTKEEAYAAVVRARRTVK